MHRIPQKACSVSCLAGQAKPAFASVTASFTAPLRTPLGLLRLGTHPMACIIPPSQRCCRPRLLLVLTEAPQDRNFPSHFLRRTHRPRIRIPPLIGPRLRHFPGLTTYILTTKYRRCSSLSSLYSGSWEGPRYLAPATWDRLAGTS